MKRLVGFLAGCVCSMAGLSAVPLGGEEIVVTGQRIRKSLSESTARVEVIDRRRIEESGALNAAEALEKQPGVESVSGIRGRSIRLQGLDPRYVLVLVNGERVAGRVDDAIDLTRIGAEEIERIEIVKGAASALYGSDAIGGVINIITRQSSSPRYFEGAMSYGSGRRIHFGSGNESSASGFAAASGDRVSNQLRAGWRRGDGYDLTVLSRKAKAGELLGPYIPLFNPDEITMLKGTTAPAFEDLSVSNRTEIKVTDSAVVAAGLSYKYLSENRTDATPPRQIFVRRNRTHDFSGTIAPRLKLNGDTDLMVSYSGNRYLDRLERDQAGSSELDRAETQEERIQEVRGQIDRRQGAHLFSLGSDFLMEEFIAERIKGRYAYRQRVALFAQDEWNAGLWTLLPGLRFEADSQFGSQTTPKLQVRLDPSDSFRLRAGGGAGFRAPSFKDLYLNFQNPGVGYRVEGNPDLKPERSRSFNAGFEFEPSDSVWISVNLFYNSLYNLIEFARQPQSSDLTLFKPANINRAYTRGAEASLEFQFRSGPGIGVSYTGLDCKDLDQGIFLSGRSRHRGGLRLSYFHRRSGLGASIQASVYSKQAVWVPKEAFATLSPAGLKLDPDAPLRAVLRGRQTALLETNSDFPRNSVRFQYARRSVDARVFWRWQEYELFAGGNNLLDEYHVTLNPERPRFFYFGLRTSWQADSPDRLVPQFETGLPIDRID